jgi:hypothetical protein
VAAAYLEARGSLNACEVSSLQARKALYVRKYGTQKLRELQERQSPENEQECCGQLRQTDDGMLQLRQTSGWPSASMVVFMRSPAASNLSA